MLTRTCVTYSYITQLSSRACEQPLLSRHEASPHTLEGFLCVLCLTVLLIAGAAHKARLIHSAQRGHLEEKVSFGACFVCCEHRPSQAGQGPGAAAEELEKGVGGGRASVGCHRPPQLHVSVSSAGRCVVRPAIHVPSLVPVVSGVLVRPKSVWVAVWDRSSPFSVSRNHAYTWPCPSGLLSLFGACMGVRPCRTRLCSGLVDRACSAPRVWCREATGAWPGGAPRLACSKRA